MYFSYFFSNVLETAPESWAGGWESDGERWTHCNWGWFTHATYDITSLVIPTAVCSHHSLVRLRRYLLRWQVWECMRITKYTHSRVGCPLLHDFVDYDSRTHHGRAVRISGWSYWCASAPLVTENMMKSWSMNFYVAYTNSYVNEL